jgi:hypothetical protein
MFQVNRNEPKLELIEKHKNNFYPLKEGVTYTRPVMVSQELSRIHILLDDKTDLYYDCILWLAMMNTDMRNVIYNHLVQKIRTLSKEIVKDLYI